MLTPSPLIDPRSEADVVRQVEELAHQHSGWTPSPEGAPDAGSALIRIFGRMVRELIDRLNRVPDRTFLAFLNLLGAEPAPARSARAALTFSPVEGEAIQTTVPAGTRVGAAALPDDPAEVVFETERALTLTQASLKAVFVREPGGDSDADRTELASPLAADFYPVFQGAAPVEHHLYLTAGEILGLARDTEVTVSVTVTEADLERWHALNDGEGKTIEWLYWDGSTWKALSPTFTKATPWTLKFSIPADMAETTVHGATQRWIRARLTAWPSDPIPEISGVTLSAAVDKTGIAPDQALSSGRPLDLSMDFFPFGEQPRFNDTFCVASEEVFSRSGATVKLTVSQSEQRQDLHNTDTPTLAWEVWNGNAWVELGRSEKDKESVTTPSTFKDRTKAFTLSATATTPVELQLPPTTGPTTVQGNAGYWLRVRLVKGDYGKGVTMSADTPPVLLDNGYRPPIVASLTLGYTHAPVVPAVCVTYNDRTFRDCTPENSAGFVPFTRPKDTEPAIYLGFDRPFGERPTLLYLQVAPLSTQLLASHARANPPAPPQVIWEYSRAEDDDDHAYAPLGAEDETGGFVESGLVSFLGPADHAPCLEFGQRLYWLRARLAEGGYPEPPLAGHVLTNTVWAVHASAVTGEIVGSGDGRPSQAFQLSQTPVLAGQQIEVFEAPPPSPEEQTEIRRLEGQDAITITTDEHGRAEGAWVRWHAVTDFNASGPRDRHYLVRSSTGELTFGDGAQGMALPRGVRNLRASYRAGGGAHGNRLAYTIDQLKTTVAYVDNVINHEDTSGGADAQTTEQVKARGSRRLRHGQQAVTAEDFEDLALEASPAVARARAITPAFNPIEQIDNPQLEEAGRVTLLLVPHGTDPRPTPTLGLLQDVEAYLKARSAPAVSLAISGPDWVKVSVSATIVPASLDDIEPLRGAMPRALGRFLHALTGGFDGEGWGFGEIPRLSDIYRLIMPMKGVDSIQTVELTMKYDDDTPLDLSGANPAKPLNRVLIFSGDHALTIRPPGGG